MPGKPKRRAESVAQRRLAGADLRRKRMGKSTRTGMTEAQLAEMARTPIAPTKRRKGKK